jgi:hypothetical protein
MRSFRVIVLMFVAFLVFGGALPGVSRSHAQTRPNVLMTAEAGFASYTKTVGWVQLRVSLENAGEAFEGTLVVSNTINGLTQFFETPVALGRGASRLSTLYIPAQSDSFDIRLRSADIDIVTVTPVLRKLTPLDRLIVTVSDPLDGWNFLGDSAVPYGGSSAIAQVTLSALPDRAAAYESVDVMIFNAVDTAALSERQRTAIRAWALSGGHLIVSGGPGAQLAASGFGDVLPAKTSRALINSGFGATAALIAPNSIERAAEPISGTAPMVALTDLTTGASVLANNNETPLIVRRPFGRGTVDQLAFDPTLAPMRDWPGNAQLFEALFQGRINAANPIDLPEERRPISDAAAALPAPDIPSALSIFVLLALYVLLVGPVNFLVLRLIKRPHLAYVTLPVLTLLFTLVGITAGLRVRGFSTQLNRLAVFTGDIGSNAARMDGIIGIYAPRTARVETSLAGALGQQVSIGDDAQPLSESPTIMMGEDTRIRNIALDGSGVKALHIQGANTDAGLARARATYRPPARAGDPGKIDIRAENISSEPLNACVALAGKDYQAIGDIAPGASADATLNMHVGHAQPGMNWRGLEILKSAFFGGRYYNLNGRSTRSSEPFSPGDYPFDLNGPFDMHALVNWHNFGADTVLRDARTGLVASLLGFEYVSPGLTLACWRDNMGTGNSVTIEDAVAADEHLYLWRVPVQPFLADFPQTLPPDVFVWDLVDSTSSAAFTSQGLTLTPGDHVIAVSPWFNMRLNGTNARVTPNLVLLQELGTGPMTGVALDIFDWKKGEFVAVAADGTIEGNAPISTGLSGDYVSSSGDVRYRIRVRETLAILSRVATTVDVP